jgi:hypothetical protein
MTKFNKESLIGILGLVIAILGIVVAFQQLQLQRLQFEYKISQKPQLEYTRDILMIEPDSFSASKAQSAQLVENFFRGIYTYRQTHPNASYSEAIHAVLPMTITVPGASIGILATIHNNGKATATKVRATLTTNRLISSFKVESVEPYQVLHGGTGKSELAIEVNRIVAGSTITITMDSRATEIGSQDKLVLDIPRYRRNALGVIELLPEDAPLPSLQYLSAAEPIIDVVVTSNEGPATRVPSEWDQALQNEPQPILR